VQGEQKGPYSLSQLKSMWESGTITSDSLYWNTESEEWKPIKELVEAPPPVLEEQPESGDEDWHVSNIALPVVNEAPPPTLKEPVQPKSPFKAIVFGTVMLVVIGVVVWGANSLLTGKPKQEELSEAEKKKQKEYREAVARESAALAPTDEEIEEDKRLRDVKLRQEKSRRKHIIGSWMHGNTGTLFRNDGSVGMFVEGRLMNVGLTWELKGNEIYVTGETGAKIIFKFLNENTIQSYHAISATGANSSSIGKPLTKTQ